MEANKFLCYMFFINIFGLDHAQTTNRNVPFKKFRCSVNIKTNDSNFCKAGLRRKLNTTAT